jgi:hypothetical protein
MPDDIDRSIWSNILLQNLLTNVQGTMWEAIHNNQHVAVWVAGTDHPIAEFIPHEGRILVELDGQQVADVDVTPARINP